MQSSKRFISLAVDRARAPESAHPGYGKEAQVSVSKLQTLHFLKLKDGGFEVTLFFNPLGSGDAPAIALGFMSDDAVAEAIKENVLSVEGWCLAFTETRALRRIL